jgi:urocanate hydratase
MGLSIHSGLAVLVDGTPEAAGKIERCLTGDPGMGIARHADAGYPLAIEAARRDGVRIPMLDSDNAKTS